MISPIAFLQHVTSSTPPSSFGFVHSLILFSYLGLAFLIGEFYGDYYGYIQCDMKTTVEYGWGMAVTSVALLGFFLHFSFVIDIVDVILLGSLAYGIHNLLQSEPRLMGQSNLPTPAISKSRGFDYPGVEVGNNWTTFRIYIKAILDNKDSRSIFYFLCLNLIYMFVQLAYGVWTNSLGLISDAIHMLFDCMALGVGLFASVMSKWSANKQFSYGFSRIETLSGFANGIFLIFISFFIIVEAIERLIHPPEMNTDRLLLVAVMGFIVNMIGIFSFHHGHGHGGHGHSHGHDHGHDHHHDHNMQVGSVGVIISTLLIQWFGWTGFDPLASLVIAILIFISSIPLIRSSMDVLMLKTPAYLWGDIQDALNRVTRIHGVISHSNPQFWPNDSSTIIGSMNVSVTGDTNEQNVVNEVLKLFKEICGIKNSDLIVEIEKVHGTTADSIAAAKNHEHGHRSKEGHSQHSHDRSGHSGAETILVFTIPLRC
ncbi:cation efflux family-domain-containing protein [Paraphysoderma sedebokerense]|nr:cation efflux family-domain-containing protein [Paraphysoderma sedebokerense]